jgi:2-iminobutanoate/2-iminopropanoate deaminase
MTDDTTITPQGNPLSLARVTDGWILSAGQVGIPAGGGPAPDDFEQQVRIAIDNLDGVLREHGGSLATVQKTTLFLVRRADFATMNRVYRECFPEPFPARSTVVCDLVKPELLFEIEAIARVA